MQAQHAAKRAEIPIIAWNWDTIPTRTKRSRVRIVLKKMYEISNDDTV